MEIWTERKTYQVLITFVVLLILLVLLGITGLGWFISQKLLRRANGSMKFPISVEEIGPQTITLQRTKNTRRPGVFGLTGPHGQAIVGALLEENAETVTRELISTVGEVQQHSKVAWNTTVYGGMFRDTLHLTLSDVRISGPLGEMPAWYVPGSPESWAIAVHGATGTREQTLRACKTLAGCGLSVLAITYRNDEGAPATGLSHLGETEWQDLEAGVRYALAQGARQVVLYGWSLGGTIVELFLDRSDLARHVRAVVLDSPILSWSKTLQALIKKNALPSFMAQVTEKIISLRTGVQLKDLDQIRPAKTHSPLPTLLFHGTSDSTAPITVSEAFVAKNPFVTFCRVEGAEHTQSWNADPSAYEKELSSFLAQALDVHRV